MGDRLGYGGNVVEIGEVGVAGESVALFALYQNLYPRDSGDVGGERLDQRNHGELFDQHAGTVVVGEGCVEINDCEPGIDQVDVANF